VFRPSTLPARLDFIAVNRPMPPQAKSQRNPAWFTRFAKWTAHTCGRPSAFLVATLVIAAWAITGPIFHYSDTWQLVINTSTTIVTFLMVFLIQNTQNRDSQALHVKLDELIRAMKGARNSLLDLDNLSDEELEHIRASFSKIAAKAKTKVADDQTETEVIAITRKK
jgi:low affinity Fe/Cu permease